MLILRLWNYIRGYVIIILEGYFLEKFINICTHRQIRLWNIRWQKSNRVLLCISIKSFKLLRPVAKKTGCRVHIIKKKGLPFVFNRYRARKAFLIGAFVFAVTFFLISSFVWDVSVTGNYKVSTEALLNELGNSGVKIGALKYKLDLEEVVENMMLKETELARISISLRGTKVYVVVNERVKPPDLINKKNPCNLVAVKDGIITSIVAKEGLETVKIGQNVTKGQILITGTIENKNNPEAAPLLVHAIGSVKAKTWYEGTAPVEQEIVRANRTGLKKSKYTLVLFTKNIKLFHGKIPYTNSEHIQISKKVSIGENVALPIGLMVDEYYEYELERVKINLDTAKNDALAKAFDKAREQIPQNVQIVSKGTSFEKDEKGKITAKAIIECVEEIGVTKEIGGR